MAIAGEDFDDAEEMTSKKLGERSACIDHSFGPSSRRHGHGSRCHGHRPSISRTSVRPRKVRTNTRPASRPRLMKDNSCARFPRYRRPEFSAAVDRLVERLRQYGAGQSAPRIGEPMPPFVLPDETGRMVSLEE